MITREADYAIRALVALARRHGDGTGAASMPEVAAEMEIPYRFLRKLSKKMVAAGLVRSLRGKGGGLMLARPPARISLYDAVTAVAPAGAVLSHCLLRPGECGRTVSCRVHGEFRMIQNDVDRRLKRVTFDTLV